MKPPHIIGIAAVLLAALILIGLMTQDGRQTSPSGAAVLGGPVTIEGTIKYLDDNVTLHATTYTAGAYTIDATAERPDNLTYASDSNPDITPPTITWVSMQNQTINEDYHTFLVFIDEPANCTLYLDGTAYVNPETDIAALWEITGLADDNYSPIYVACEDLAQNDGYSTQAWLAVDTYEEPPSKIVNIIATAPMTEIPEGPEPETGDGETGGEVTGVIIPDEEPEEPEDSGTTGQPSEPLAEPEEEPDFLTSLVTDPVRFGVLLGVVIILAGAVIFLKRK